MIGNPINIYECTTKKLRISFARVLVEVDVNQKTKEMIWIKDHTGKIFEQKVEYEWKPKYCHQFLKIGHDCSILPIVQKKVKEKVWKPKAVVTVERKEPERVEALEAEGNWTEVPFGKGDKGKKPTVEDVCTLRVMEIICNNSFNRLQTGSTLRGEPSHVP